MLVLQHCRGNDEIDRDSEHEESEDEDEYNTDGAVDEKSHRMVCCIPRGDTMQKWHIFRKNLKFSK